jgi:type II secretory pathway predicted ATPase ExeA
MQATTTKIENAWPSGGSPSFHSASHEEGLARAHFLVDQCKQLGLLVGDSGSGKTTLLAALAEELRRSGRRVASVNLYALSSDEVLWKLAAALGLNPAGDATVGQLWREITDLLAAARFQQQHVVLLFDDVDRAQPDVLTSLVRLNKCDPAAVGQQTMVLACRTDRVTTLGDGLLELATLRIELAVWSAEETAQYLESRAEAEQLAAAPEAAEQLHELSAGVPRRVSQLLDLAIVAAKASAIGTIDVSLLRAVDGQLAVSHS